jgi:hypothetical protein
MGDFLLFHGGSLGALAAPGQSVKRYLAGPLDARTGKHLCVEGVRKASALFIALLEQSQRFYPRAASGAQVGPDSGWTGSAVVAAVSESRLLATRVPPRCCE